MKGLVATMICAAAMSLSTSSFALSTIGDRTCGAWVSDRAEATGNLGSTSWLTGLMTGLAIASDADVLKNTDGPSMLMWMDNYCRAHPLDRVATGATTLYFELRGRMGK